MKYFKFILISSLCLLMAVPALRADEGMWMINAINSAIEKNMKARGLKLSAREIYNADADGAGLSDAVVSLEFGCTGSIISDQGLVITNHHCAYGDVHALSSDEHNYLENGFWAMNSNEEVPIRGKQMLFLKKVLDVTEEVRDLSEHLRKEGKPFGMRRLSSIMERKYSKEYGYEAYLSSMWSGTEYYIALYQVYSDVRLVAAPPVSMSAFGGDIDNWEWPQHKCDFAMYRIYTAPDGSPATYSEENVPLVPVRKLNISLAGYRPGDFTMVIGYPGRTKRYVNSDVLNLQMTSRLPVSNEIRGEQIRIMNALMNADPAVRLKYSDFYFSLTNVQELNEGQVQCCKRFGTVAGKAAEEKQLQAWIDADPARQAKWGTLLKNLHDECETVSDIVRNKTVFQETIVRGNNLSRFCSRIHACNREKDPESCANRLKLAFSTIGRDAADYDMKVEKALFRYSFTKYMTEIDAEYFGPYQSEIAAALGLPADAAQRKTAAITAALQAKADEIWDNSLLTHPERYDEFEGKCLCDMNNDPFVKFMSDTGIMSFNEKMQEAQVIPLNGLEKEYTRALYEMRAENGIAQYPDANSTMRITYGTVGGISPRDAVRCSWHSTTKGILEKYNPESYEFTLSDRQRQLYAVGDWGRWGTQPWIHTAGGKWKQDRKAPAVMYVNFLTDNDITGGNSGSPVLNARGELIGLAFDGNKESLASDAEFVDGYNKCVCVDIRYILWTLDRYAGMTRILAELGL